MVTQNPTGVSSALDSYQDSENEERREPSQPGVAEVQVQQSGIQDLEKVSSASEGKTATDNYEYVTGIKLALILAAVTLVYFLIMLDGSIVATVGTYLLWIVSHVVNSELILSQAIPKITTEFHSLLDVGWYGSAYQLAKLVLLTMSRKKKNCIDPNSRLSASLQPLSGKIYTYFTTKVFHITPIALKYTNNRLNES